MDGEDAPDSGGGARGLELDGLEAEVRVAEDERGRASDEPSRRASTTASSSTMDVQSRGARIWRLWLAAEANTRGPYAHTLEVINRNSSSELLLASM